MYYSDKNKEIIMRESSMLSSKSKALNDRVNLGSDWLQESEYVEFLIASIQKSLTRIKSALKEEI